jgi:hypothetical protein
LKRKTGKELLSVEEWLSSGPHCRKDRKVSWQRHRVSLWYGRTNAERVVELAHIFASRPNLCKSQTPQGNRVKDSGCNETCEEVVIPCGGFAGIAGASGQKTGNVDYESHRRA